MQHLGRWLAKEVQPRFPLVEFLIGVLGVFVFLGTIPGREAQGAFDLSNPVVLRFLGMLFLAVAAWVPMLVSLRRRPSASSLQPLLTAYQTGRLAEELGDQAAGLEAAARDLEQIQALAQTQLVPTDLASSVTHEAERRLRQACEFTVGPPALYGATTADAPSRIEADVAWLGHARELVERITIPTPKAQAEDPLLNLRTFVSAHEEAVKELSANG